MTIGKKVTLWYGLVMFISAILTGGGMYYELVYERNATRAQQKPEEPMEEELGEIFLYFFLPAMVATVLGGWWLLRRSLKPLDQLTTAAERINAENLREPLPRTGNGDEVDRLSEVLNAMNQRISGTLHEIHDFMLHASHELKTPLTILHSEIETALTNASEEQRETFVSQLDEILRLTRIVEGLNLVARTNSGQTQLAQDSIAFHEIVRDMAEDASALARPGQISVRTEEINPGWIIGDRHRLRQMLLNLVDNAAKYNEVGGSIRISSRSIDGKVVFEIANTGNGISSGDLQNVFKKFYRGPRSSDRAGLGLGLTIAQAIVKAHRGEIAVDNSKSGWTIVRVTLPQVPDRNAPSVAEPLSH